MNTQPKPVPKSFRKSFLTSFRFLTSSRFLPLANQLVGYDRTGFRSDLMAGLTVGVVLIPQGMAYALVAGLPPIYGLYTSLVPLVVYAFLGTSRQLAVGPTALASLLTATAVAPIAGGNVEKFIALAVLLSLMAGVVQVVLGLVRAGFLANFLSRPVLAGFSTAAALIIGLGQLKHILGVEMSRSDRVPEIVASILDGIPVTHMLTLGVGLLALMLMAGLRKWKPAFPAALLVLVLGTAAAWWFNLDARGLAIIGNVPAGIPLPHIPTATLEDIRSLVPGMLTILAIGIIESIAIGKYYASKNGYEIDANKELTALGTAKIIGSFFSAFPNTGGFSRTAVNADSGAKTQVSTLVSASVVALALLFLTPLFEYLPKVVLGSIIIIAVMGLVDTREIRYLWRVDRQDFSLMAMTFFATAIFGIETGILSGIVASLALVLNASSRPYSAVMGRLPGTDTFRNVDRFSNAITLSGVVILRVDASLFFANASYVKSRIGQIVTDDPALKVLIMDLYPVNRIDSSALHSLVEQVGRLKEIGVRVLFAGAKGPIRDKMNLAGVVKTLGNDCFFHEVADAAEAAASLIDDSDADESVVRPLLTA